MAKSRKRQDDATAVADTPAGAPGNTEAPDMMPDQERISARAYELYLQRGASDGQAWDDWLAAERELRGGSSSEGDSGE